MNESQLKTVKQKSDSLYGEYDSFFDDSIKALNIKVQEKKKVQENNDQLIYKLKKCQREVNEEKDNQQKLLTNIDKLEQSNQDINSFNTQTRQQIIAIRDQIQQKQVEWNKQEQSLNTSKQAHQESLTTTSNDLDKQRKTWQNEKNLQHLQMNDLNQQLDKLEGERYDLYIKVKGGMRNEQERLKLVKNKQQLLDTLIFEEKSLDNVRTPRLSLLAQKGKNSDLRNSFAFEDKENSDLNTSTKNRLSLNSNKNPINKRNTLQNTNGTRKNVQVTQIRL